jgi:uncharacterized protein involved in exopolysaccharide biosynthesis
MHPQKKFHLVFSFVMGAMMIFLLAPVARKFTGRILGVTST